jgi:hypothetical protein
MVSEQDKEKVKTVADAARGFVSAYDEFDGDPSCVGEDLEALIDVIDKAFSDEAKPSAQGPILPEYV